MLLLLVLLCHLHIPFWQLNLMPMSTIQRVLLRLGLLDINVIPFTHPVYNNVWSEKRVVVSYNRISKWTTEDIGGWLAQKSSLFDEGKVY